VNMFIAFKKNHKVKPNKDCKKNISLSILKHY
jgi:hypothetical protein